MEMPTHGSNPAKAEADGADLLPEGAPQSSPPSLGEHSGETHATKYQTAFNIFGITCFPLALPFAFGQAGFAAGILLYILIAMAAYLNAWLIADICIRVRLSPVTYPSIAEAAFGWRGSALVNICQCLNFFLFSVYALVVIGSSLSQTGTSVCQNGWIGVIAALLVPFVQIPSFEQLSFLGIVYAILTLVSLVILVQQSATEGICDGNDRDYDSISAFSVLSGAVTFGFAFSGSGVFPELISEMADKREFHGVFGSLTLSWLVIVPVNLLAGVAGFAAFGNKVSGTVIMDYPQGGARTAAAACVSFLLAFALLESNQVLALKLERHFGIQDPAAKGAFQGLPPLAARGVVRTLLLAIQTAVALGIFNAGAGDLSILCGALGGMPLTFTVPIFCHLRLLPERSSPVVKKLLIMCAALAMALAVCGVYVGVAGLAGSGSSGGAFGGPCIATTDTYGETTANYRGNVGRCGW